MNEIDEKQLEEIEAYYQNRGPCLDDRRVREDVEFLLTAVRAQAEQIKARDEKLAQAQADAAVCKAYARSLVLQRDPPLSAEEKVVLIAKILLPHPGQPLLDEVERLRRFKDKMTKIATAFHVSPQVNQAYLDSCAAMEKP